MKYCFSILSLIISLHVFAQFSPFGFQEEEMQWENESISVFRCAVPYQADIAKSWKNYIKAESKIKFTEENGYLKSEVFTIPYTDQTANLFTWIEQTEDSSVIRTSLKIHQSVDSYLTGYTPEDQFLRNLVKQFNIQNTKDYYEKRIAALKNKRKRVKGSIKSMEKRYGKQINKPATPLPTDSLKDDKAVASR